MERICIKGNTWCLTGRQMIPYYQVDDNHCILIDPGKESDREPIAKALEEAGLTPIGILLTHMHYDHHVNTGYFKEKYGIPAAMPRGEAEICRNQATLKNHLFCFTPGLIATTPRLYELVCPIEQPIEMEETVCVFQGVEFGVFHAPGHSPDHVCYITPDNVAIVGDAILCGQDLQLADVPFCFGLALDIETKERLKGLHCERYIVAHNGIVESADWQSVLEKNILRVKGQADYMCSLITEETTLDGCYEIINQALGQAGGHPIRNNHLERYLRPYLEYLVDTGKLIWVTGCGAPTVAPSECRP